MNNDTQKDFPPEVILPITGWKKFVSVVKQVSASTGKGLAYLYQTGDENKHYTLPIINGLVGDTLAKIHHPLTIPMSFRGGNRDIAIESLNLRDRLVNQGQHVIVFVHGLMGDEILWQASDTTETMIGYGTSLEKELGITPLYLRYNTGLHISENGKNLNGLLQKLVDTYGENIQKITLIGYSMGGLVVRSAGYYADKQQQHWRKKLTSVVLISVPNDGSYLEHVGHLTTWILRTIPNIPTRLIADTLDKRSAGIKDLRCGFMVEEDWRNQDRHRSLATHRTLVEPLAGVTYHIIVSTISDNELSPLALFFGDGLVGKRSAVGQVFINPYLQSTVQITCRTFPKTNHATILNNEEVYQYLKQLLEPIIE